MTQFLPPNLLALFAPRDPPPFLPPVDKLTHEKKRVPYMGIAQYTNLFEDPKDTPPPTRAETRDERRERKQREKAEQVAYKLEQEIAVWDPHSNGTSTMDPFKTLFIARINYDTSESKLRREFEVYGNIRKIVLVVDQKTGKPRGYAFVEYEHERDMHSAYKHADGKKIDGRRVLVDVERARTVKGWLPRRLGGGLGGTRRGGPDVNVKHSGREDNERERQRYLDRERDRERGGTDRGADRERDRVVERERDRGDRDRSDRERGDKRRSRSRDRERRKRSRSRERKRARRGSGERSREGSRERVRGRRSEDRTKEDSENTSERKKEKDREKDRKDRRDRDDRGKERDKDRKKSKRSRSRERRDKDRERERRDYPRNDEGEQIHVKEEPPDDYGYPAQEYEDDYNHHYNPDNVKYEQDGHFQPDEY